MGESVRIRQEAKTKRERMSSLFICVGYKYRVPVLSAFDWLSSISALSKNQAKPRSAQRSVLSQKGNLSKRSCEIQIWIFLLEQIRTSPLKIP